MGIVRRVVSAAPALATMKHSKPDSKSRVPTEIRTPEVFADSVGYHLVELFSAYSRLIEGRTHSVLLDLNVTQWRTLTLIRFNPDQTQQALARHIGIDPSSMTPIVNLLERKGWVLRRQSPTNRSAYGLRVTPAGLKAYRQIEVEMARSEELFAKILGGTNRRELSVLMQTLRHALLDTISAPEPTPRRRRHEQ